MFSSASFSNEALLVESVKRKLNFDEPRINRMETEFIRVPIWQRKKGRRLDFGESDPSVLAHCPDPLPILMIPDPVPRSSDGTDRIIFTAAQKSKLEALFRRKKYPTRKEKASLAAKLDVPLIKVMTWFTNRRQKWRKKQKKEAVVRPSAFRPVLPGSSRIHRSVQGYAYYSRSAQFPTPPQWFPPTFYPVSGPVPSASSLVTRPLAVPVPTPVAGPAPLHYQQPYSPFPTPVRMTTQLRPETNFGQTAASSYTTHRSMPAGDPVAVPPEDRQDPAAEFQSLADEFPFSYSIAKELPHIFGNVDEDEVLDRPLTPSFEPAIEFDSISESSSLDSDQSVESSTNTDEDFTDCHQPRSYDSCCFGGSESFPLIRDISYGLVSTGKHLRFFRQD